MIGYTQAKRYAATLRFLPAEARAALREGGEWRDRGLDATMGVPFVAWCDDCDTYHKDTFVAGYAVEGGALLLLIWLCDEDGDWQTADSAEVGTPEEAALWHEYGYEASREGWADYHQYMARTGLDPVGDTFATSAAEVAEIGYRALIRDGYAFTRTLYAFLPKVASVEELDADDPRLCSHCGGLGDGTEAHVGTCAHCGGWGVEPEYFDRDAAEAEAQANYDAEMAAQEREYQRSRF